MLTFFKRNFDEKSKSYLQMRYVRSDKKDKGNIMMAGNQKAKLSTVCQRER